MRFWAGQAHHRTGGNVPLIAIATWGAIKGRDSLLVSKNEIHAGYLTKIPVNYECSGGGTELESNHTHFVLVDDGSAGKFGREIHLRGGFEAAARAPRGSDLERRVLAVLRMPREAGQCLGWDGGAEAGGDPPAAWDEAGRAICLCFEGGPNTVGTVAASTRNGTPVLVFRGTGRAADLIADCLHVHGLGARRGRADDLGRAAAADLELDQGREVDSIRMHRLVLICRLLPLAKEWHSLSLGKGPEGRSWPPTVDGRPLEGIFGKEALLANTVPWVWKRRKGRWVHTHDPAQSLEPGSDRHLALTLQVDAM